MSWSINLFVEAPVAMDSLVQEIQECLGRQLKRVDEGLEMSYELHDQGWFLTVGKHDLVNDRDMAFETYSYQIAIWSTNSPDWTESQKRCYELGKQLFTCFSLNGRYRLMLTKNLQTKLEAFNPKGGGN